MKRIARIAMVAVAMASTVCVAQSPEPPAGAAPTRSFGIGGWTPASRPAGEADVPFSHSAGSGGSPSGTSAAGDSERFVAPTTNLYKGHR